MRGKSRRHSIQGTSRITVNTKSTTFRVLLLPQDNVEKCKMGHVPGNLILMHCLFVTEIQRHCNLNIKREISAGCHKVSILHGQLQKSCGGSQN